MPKAHPLVTFAQQQPLGAIGLLVILAMIFAGAFAEFVAPYDPLAINYMAILAPPSAEHWMGTDDFGRDILSRVIYGARTALAIGFISSLLGCSIGALIGMVSAHFGGWTDTLIQRVMDVLLSFPIIVLALAVVAVLGKNVVLGIDVNLIIAIGLPIVPKVARVVRSSPRSASCPISAARVRASRTAASSCGTSCRT